MKDHRRCLCGHDRSAHEHYRGGTECALCPQGKCQRFRAATPIRRLLARIVGSG